LPQLACGGKEGWELEELEEEEEDMTRHRQFWQIASDGHCSPRSKQSSPASRMPLPQTGGTELEEEEEDMTRHRQFWQIESDGH